MARPKDLGLEHTWRLRLRRQVASGLSIPEFCLREGVSTASFYALRRRLAAPPVATPSMVREAGACPSRPGSLSSPTLGTCYAEATCKKLGRPGVAGHITKCGGVGVAGAERGGDEGSDSGWE
jgi:hypothetical protein